MTAVQFVPQLDGVVVALRLLTRADVTAYARAFTEDPDLGRLLGLGTEPRLGSGLRIDTLCFGLLDDEWSRRVG